MLCAEPEWPHHCEELENAINEEGRQRASVFTAERSTFLNVVEVKSLM